MLCKKVEKHHKMTTLSNTRLVKTPSRFWRQHRKIARGWYHRILPQEEIYIFRCLFEQSFKLVPRPLKQLQDQISEKRINNTIKKTFFCRALCKRKSAVISNVLVIVMFKI